MDANKICESFFICLFEGGINARDLYFDSPLISLLCSVRRRKQGAAGLLTIVHCSEEAEDSGEWPDKIKHLWK